nr:PREDICTED: leucine-rich repeat serine/threonine-protein kinase 2 [Lepisosteus oculatus]
MANKEELEEKLKKLIVRLKNVQEGKQLDTLIQILEDLLFLTFAGDCATELFEDKDVHLPLMVVLDSYIDSHAVQEVGWSLLCRLMEVCPSTLEKLSAPQVEKDWEVLGIHQQILKMLSLHNGHSKLMMIGLRALSHLLQSDAILLMILEENIDVFLLIVDAMTVFCSNEEIQIYGCKSLQLLLEKVPDVHLIEFVETQDHNAILNAARQFQDNEDTVLHALRVLLPLAGPASNVEVLMSGNERCYSLIMCAMGSYPNNEKLQEVGCRLFLKFTSESYYNILVLNGVHKVIVKASEMYPRNASLQASALSCLASLTETIILNKDLDEWKEEDDICWVDSCVRALELHRASAMVQEAACWALNNLLVYESQLHEMFGDDEGRYPVHRQVMASMLLHSSSQRVFQAAANTLATLVDQNSKIRALLLSNGLHINIIDMMKKHSTSPDVAESACRLLYKLFQVRMTTLDEVTMAMAEILNAMKTHNSVLSVQLEGLRASLMLLNPDRRLKEHGSSVGDPDMVDVTLKVLKNQCVLEGAHTVFLEALNKFIGSPAIQECGLNVLSALAESSGALELMSQQGALDTVLHTLQMFSEEKEIHFLALNLLHSLISKQKISPAAVPVLASVLMKSLQRYHDNLEVQFKGLQVAWKLLNLSTIAAEELAKESFDTVIFQQMNNCLLEQKNNSVLNLCCMCLSKMAHDSDIKYSMLEKACAVCDIVMAECLIQLGADINKKTKKESLICQVCERTSCPELVELLLKSGTHEQHIRKALNISIRKRDGPVISLLLKKLGLDLANNAICLGGFRLGHIESSWLSPLFLERRTCSFRRRTSKGISLSRVILKYQKRQAALESQRSISDVSSSGYTSDETEDWVLSPQDDSSAFINEDIESDGSDGILHMKRISQSDLSGEFRGSFETAQKVRHRYPSSEGESGDSEQSEVHRQRLSRRSSNQQSRFSSILTSPEHSSLFNVDKECIKLLDLSANELDSLNTIAGQNSITAYLEHIVRLELNQNNLTEFSLTLCETLKGVTHLDLHSNKFQSLPTGVLSMLSLKVLNLSRNDIGPCLSLDPMIRCSNLKQLVLSYNQLSSFPDHLGQVIQTLEELYLEGNKIAEITSPLPLPELRVLDVSKNDIMEICENFLSDCPKLESFNVSMNKLRRLPDLPSKLTTIKLSHNEFTCIPDAIVKLPYLRSIDMRNNQITVLPSPSEWESSNLRELVFSHNQISELNISGPVYKWARLEKLHLCKNKLKEIPPQIGLLENVTSLDVSKNSDLRSFPNEMGKLERLWDLPLDELQLDLDLKHIGSKTKDIIRFLQQRLKKSVPYYRMKLIVVGNSESGKTALLNQLMKLKRSQCRTEKMAVAIDVKDWAIRDKGKKSIVLNVWDFSGREEFYGSHTHFLTPRALYLVVYDLSKGAAEVDAIKPWLFNIKARASSSPVILVGTHMDVAEEKHLQACVVKISNELLNHQGFPVIRDCHIVTATEDSDSIGKLRKAIVKEVMNFKIQDQPVIGQLIPDSYLELEKKILQERERVPAEFPVICQQRLLDIVQENQLNLDESELPHAIHFLSESGVLLHFDDPALQLRDLYFVDPQWLCNIISQILTLNGEGLSKYPKGIVQRSVVENFLFEKKSFPRNYVTQYFKLLEKFQIALPFGEDQLLIPSSLADSRPVIELPHCENSEIIVRLYEMPYFPMGFWSRLINRLLEVSMFMLSGRERPLRPNRMYWRKGIYLNWSPEAYCLVESTTMDNVPESFVKITVPCSQKGNSEKENDVFQGFRAPEVARGNVIYNQQADIYSFGLLLYDLLTGGERITDGMKFPSEFDEIAVQGKLPELEDSVFERLSSGELLCLMREVPIPGAVNAECFVVSSQSKKPRVWIGSGSSRRTGQVGVLDLETGKYVPQDVDNSPVLCLTMVCFPGEKDEWVVAGTQSGKLLVINTEDTASKHTLQNMTDAVTCLFLHSYPKHSKEKNFLLVGTADGALSVFEDTAIKSENGKPQKILQIGNINTPLVCLSESAYSQDKNTIWAGCGAKVVSLTKDYDIWKTIDIKPNYQLQQRSCSETNIIRMAVDKYIYLTKKESHVVEIWDKKTERMTELIDCSHFLKQGSTKRPHKKFTAKDLFSVRVKTLLLQQNITLWIGTRGGHMILVDLSTRQPIRVIPDLCESIRSMAIAQIDKMNPRSIVLVLGRPYETSPAQFKYQHENEKSVMYIWNQNLPLEVQSLQKHCEMRQEIAEKMRMTPFD